MLPVYYLFYNFLKLILTVFANSAPNGINKSFGFAQTLRKKDFKFLLSDGNVGFIFYVMLILLLAKKSRILEKDSCKGYPVLTFGTSGCKIVFALLEKVITL